MKLVTRHTLNAPPTAPLLVLVHGRAGNVNVMWNFSRAFPEGVNIVSFEAFISDPQDGGFSWWLLETPLVSGCTSASDILRENIEAWIHENNLQPRRIIGAGFSQGAVLLSHLAQTSSIFSQIALLSGFVFETTQTPAVFPRIFMYHGTNDGILPFSKAEQGRDYLSQKGFQVEFLSESVSHRIGIEGMRALKVFLSSDQ